MIAPGSNALRGLQSWALGVDLEDRTFRPGGENYVKGVGYATWHYLCMLAGNDDLVKPDVHVKTLVREVLGFEPSRR